MNDSWSKGAATEPLPRPSRVSPCFVSATACGAEVDEIPAKFPAPSSPVAEDSASNGSIDSRASRWSLMAIPPSATPIPEQVGFRLDFPRWLSIQSDRNRRLILALASGDSTSEAAQRFHISAARGSQLRLQFFESWRAFQQDVHGTPARAAA